jgi:hypothetical protein
MSNPGDIFNPSGADPGMQPTSDPAAAANNGGGTGAPGGSPLGATTSLVGYAAWGFGLTLGAFVLMSVFAKK